MSLAVEILKQDLKVARKNIDKNVANVNIIGNRIMTNLLVADDEEKNLMLVGWIVKDIGGELVGIEASKDKAKLANGIHTAKTYLDKLSEMIAKKEYGEQKLFEIYFDYQKNMRVHLLPIPDDTSYTIKPEFTRKVNLMLIQHFLDNKKLLLQEKNTLITGVLNDLALVINMHGAKEEDYITYLIFKAFVKYYEYALYSETDMDGRIGDKESLESKLSKYIQKIEEMKLMIEDNVKLEELYKFSTDILYELAVEFRKYYMNYSDIFTQVVPRKIELLSKAVAEEPKEEAT